MAGPAVEDGGREQSVVSDGSRPTITDVALLAGVSKSAVSKVYNGRGGISDQTRVRIHSAAEKLGWSPSATAAALTSARTRTIGLVINRSPDLLSVDPYFAELITGIECVLAPRDYGLFLQLIGARGQGETETYQRLARERRVDGFLLTENRVGDGRYEMVEHLGVPAVTIGRPWSDCSIPYLPAEDEQGIVAAVEHLIGLGHQRIAYLAGPNDLAHTLFRREAFERALDSMQIAPAAIRSTEFTAAASADTTGQLLDQSHPPTAVVYANDTMAISGMSLAQRRGLSVPGDLSVLGHDDLPLSEWTYPQLTTIQQDVQQLGAAAAAQLLELVGEDVQEAPQVAPPRLIVRDSTGPASRAF